MITLRQLRKEDVPALYDMYMDYPAMVNQAKIYGIDWLYRVVEDVDQYRYAVLDDETLAGIATLWWSSRVNGILSPTVWIELGRQGRNIGWTALVSLWSIAINNIPSARKLSAVVYEYNEKSLKLSDRFFFGREAVIPNQVFYLGKYWSEIHYGKYRL